MNVIAEPIHPVRTPSAFPALSPSQRIAFEALEAALSVSPVVGLVGPAGCGRTLIAQTLAAKHGGCVLDMSDVFAAAEPHAGAQWEEAVEARVIEALDCVDLVIVDDYTSFATISAIASVRRRFFPQIVARRLYAAADQAGKRLVLVGSPPPQWVSVSDAFGDRATMVTVPSFGPDDYRAIASHVLGTERVAKIDFALVHRYAAHLQGYQLRLACQLLANETAPVTDETFMQCLGDYVLSSNMRIGEVEALSFDSLPGTEEIVDALETNIVLPFENRKLAQQMGLKPKRGVLLYGPPGTGKTSIGRALAHRMKGKFFLIDGSFISEPPTEFFYKVQNVIEQAKRNSPSVLFIDDADVLFRIDHIAGLVRYLLSLLDGVESETASNVCVMMTAMDVRRIPEALLRSGRVELWLETKPPTQAVRGRIVQRWMGSELPGHEAIDYAALAELTEGFTPADLRRIAGDAKALYAADIVSGRAVSAATDYLRRAVADVMEMRNNMAHMLGDDSLRIGSSNAAASAD